MTLTFDTIKPFELLKPKIGAEESKAVVEALEQIPAVAKREVSEQMELARKELATKGDILVLREDIQSLRQDLLRLEVKMQEKFNSMLIWLMATILGTAGIVLAVVKLF